MKQSKEFSLLVFPFLNTKQEIGGHLISHDLIHPVSLLDDRPC